MTGACSILTFPPLKKGKEISLADLFISLFSPFVWRHPVFLTEKSREISTGSITHSGRRGCLPNFPFEKMFLIALTVALDDCQGTIWSRLTGTIVYSGLNILPLVQKNVAKRENNLSLLRWSTVHQYQLWANYFLQLLSSSLVHLIFNLFLIDQFVWGILFDGQSYA